MYNGPGRKRPRLSIDQICSNVASSQLSQLEDSADSLLSRPLPVMITSFTSSSVTTAASFSVPPATHIPSTSEPPNEALNLSISNRSPSTSTTSLLHQPVAHQKVLQRGSWPQAALSPTKLQDYRSRRDSADSDPVGSTSAKLEDNIDEAGKERRRRQKLANKDNLFCQVCGDKANGYNFGAITCESCKAFFRRNAQKNKDLKCNFENNCKIDHFTRKFCTACRLAKCFSVSMKKEWILDEDALKKRKKLIRRPGNDKTPETPGDIDYSRLASVSAMSFPGAVVAPHLIGLHPLDPAHWAASAWSHSQSPDELIPLTDADRAVISTVMENHDMIVTVSPNSSAVTTPTLTPSTSLPQDLQETVDVIPPSKIKTEPELEPYVVVHPEEPPGEVNLDNDTESGKESNTEDTENSSTSTQQAVPTPSIHPDEVINMAEDFIKRLITFVKSLPEFSLLSRNDQVCLLKGGILETLVIRSAAVQSDSCSEETIDSPKSNNKLLKDMIRQHTKFITKLNQVAKWDKTTTTLCMLINLFSPLREGLIARESVANAAARYDLLLQSYLRSKYSSREVSSMYPELIATLDTVKSYGEQSSKQMYGVTPAELEPLMRDMFSMK